MSTRKALITGITGQDGSYLADLLSAKSLFKNTADPARVRLG